MTKVKTDNNFVRSGRERIKDDNYQTIDSRCIRAFVETFHISPEASITDCCSPNGSGILNELNNLGYKNTHTMNDAFGKMDCDWNIFNPPYARNVVDKIIIQQIDNLSAGKTRFGIAALLRTSFDHAKTRQNMFNNNLAYAGQLKMLFRPIWFTDGDSTPIHNYSWFIWKSDNFNKQPRVWYW